jgi:hypothetical protein
LDQETKIFNLINIQIKGVFLYLDCKATNKPEIKITQHIGAYTYLLAGNERFECDVVESNAL